VNRLTRILPATAALLGAVLLFACTGEVTGPPEPGFARTGSTPTTEYTLCSPEPPVFASAWMGPKGGTLKAGRHAFVVPAGALSTNILITMESRSGSINRVILGPEGLTFTAPYKPRLVMSYGNCLVSASAEQQIAYLNSLSGVLEPTPSVTNSLDRTVAGVLSHFSEYVLLSTYAVVY
jgi:hypothetical protein